MLKFLSKKETKKLECETTPILGALFERSNGVEREKEQSSRMVALLFSLLNWANKNGLTTNDPQKLRNEKMISLLEASPKYFAIFRNRRTAVWGVDWDNGNRALIFLSKRGLGIELAPGFNDDKVETLLKYLSELLLN